MQVISVYLRARDLPPGTVGQIPTVAVTVTATVMCT